MKLKLPATPTLGVGLLFGIWLAACSAPSPDNDATSDNNNGDGDGDGGSVDLPDGVESTDLLPARVRRLTNAEYDAAVQSLLGTSEQFGVDFPQDTRQHGYTLNEAQRVDPILARGLDKAATALAAEAVQNIGTLAPCSDPGAGGQACAEAFIDEFASEAYRRPLSAEEKQGLLGLYGAATVGEGADPSQSPEAMYADGISLVIRGVLQSPGFLYVTETGGAEPEGSIQLTQYEIASAIGFLTAGAPPDGELIELAEQGSLSDPVVREAQARRLIETPEGRTRAVEVLRQWLGIDRISVTAKDATVYPGFADVRDEMAQETEDFVRGVLDYDGGTVSTLLTGESAVARPGLSAVYSAAGPPRHGLLNQGAFLSVYSHAHETGPVLRGTTVMRRVACIEIEIPTNLLLEIVPPVPDPAATTRERFSVHTEDDSCASCHNLIDPIGFSFEQFDGMGAYRDTENGKPVDSSGTVVLGRDFDGTYESSTDLVGALGASSDVAECFARQLYRAHAGEATGIDDSEEAFVDDWSGGGGGASFVEALVAFVKSDSFIYRRNL